MGYFKSKKSRIICRWSTFRNGRCETSFQDNAGDILAEAQQINEERAAKEAAEAEIVEETEENTGAEDFKEEEV